MKRSIINIPYALIRGLVVFSFISVALFTSHSAEARKNALSNVVSLYPVTSLSKACSNCHADWSGKDTRNNAGVAYYLYQNGVTVSPTNAFFLNDADGDGSSTGTEFSNSQSTARPALPAKWFPNYADKDGDGCIQLYSRSDENGMPIAAAGIRANGYLGASKGFVRYAPHGWDIDDNDVTQGCSTAWPITATPGTFVNPGVTTDVTPPAPIADLRASALAFAAMPLTWTAVGDDGMNGMAYSYDLRYTTAALAATKLTCGAGSGACNVRLPSDWELMYDYADSNVDDAAGKYLGKTGGTLASAGGKWNSGAVSPLMRALYEPIPSTPGAPQICNALGLSSSCTASPGASYVLTSKGSSAVTNTIVNGMTYWLAIRTSDGVLKPTHVETPIGFTENVSPISNIVAITAGSEGTSTSSGAAISSISPGGLTAAVASTTITVVGFGLNSGNAAQMVLTNSAGTVLAAAANLTYTATAVSGNFACGTVANGTYNIELRTTAGVTKAAWVNAITAAGFMCIDPLIIVNSVTPDSRGQGADNQDIIIDGQNFCVGPISVTFSGSGIIVNSVTVISCTRLSVNISVASNATVGVRTLTVSAPNALPASVPFSITAAPIVICTPPVGTVGVAYTYICSASGGVPPYTWLVPSLPPGLNFTISADTTTMTISGTPFATGTFAGSLTVTDSNAGRVIQVITIVIGKAEQSIGPIIFTPSTLALGGITTASATGGASGNPVFFVSVTPSVCIVSGINGSTIVGVSAGTCTIAANQAGNANYNAAPTVTQSIVVAKANQTIGPITFTPSILAVGGSTLASATGGASGNPVTFVSLTPSVCAVSGINGSTVTGVSAGSCTINANQAGNANYNAAPAVPGTIRVEYAPPIIIPCGFSPPTLAVGGTTTVCAYASNGLPVTFSSVTPAVCTTLGINGSTVFAVSVGTCIIAANQADSALYIAPSPVTQSIIVTKANQTIGSITFTPSILAVGGSTLASATASSGLAVTFTSLTTSVCTVSGTNGSTIVGVSAGTCTIAANQAGNANYNAAPSVTSSIAVIAVDPLTPSISAPTVTSIGSTTATLGATVTSANLGGSIIARGTCWGTSPAPTTNCVAEGGTTTGVFTQARSGFTLGIPYYFRGYATNAAGISYTSDGTFTTSDAVVPPVVTSSGTASGTIGVPFAYQILATNNPTGYGATGLPAGISVNATNGLISGTYAASAPDAIIQVVISGTVGQTFSSNWYALPTSTFNAVVSASNAAGSGSLPVAISMSCNNYSATGLPPGLTMNAMTGLVTGTPLIPGSFPVTLHACGLTWQSFTIYITASAVPGAPMMGTATGGNASATVSFAPPASTGSSPILYYTVTAIPSSGPPMLSVGVASPITVTGLTNYTNYTFTVSATNSAGTGPSSAISNSVYLEPCDLPPSITSPDGVSGSVGLPFSYQISASSCDGVQPNSYNATGLPPGLVVNTSSGLISGVPTTSGVFHSTVTASVASSTVSKTVTITIVSPSITSPSTASGVSGMPFSYQITASNCTATLPCVYEAYSLPPGLTVNASTGLISGTPTMATWYSVLVLARGVDIATADVVITIEPAVTPDVDLVMTSVSTTSAYVGAGNSFVIDNTEANVGTTNMTAADNAVIFYLSIDAMISGSDIELTGSQTVSALAAGTNSFASTMVTVPSTVAPGVYYVGACADATYVQPETNETNNCREAGTIVVIRDVDLVMTAVSTTSTSVPVGATFMIDNTELNLGTTNMTAANNTVRFYLSTDPMITTSDSVLTGSRVVPALAAGASSSSSTIVTVPSTVVPGTYYVGACADATYLQPETDEVNNCRSAVTITVF